jgi:hypothetical protein
MKQYLKWLSAPLISLVVFSCMPFFAMAQGPDPDVPIDGGLSLLIAAGVGYGAKKYRDSRKQKRPE